jgi:hypothetical protein
MSIALSTNCLNQFFKFSELAKFFAFLVAKGLIPDLTASSTK